MSQEIKLIRSNVPGKKPDKFNLNVGELALNTADGLFYFKRGDDTVQTLVSTNAVIKDNVLISGDFYLTGSSEFSGSVLTIGDSSFSGSINVSSSATFRGPINLYPTEAPSIGEYSASFYVTSSTNDLWIADKSSSFNFTSITDTLKSGIIAGGVVSTGSSNTVFNVTSGSGQIVDINKDGIYGAPQPTIKYVEWDTFEDQSLTYLSSAETTWLLIDSDGNLVQQPTTFTDSQYETHIIIGAVIHPNNTSIALTKTFPVVSYGSAQQFEDFIRIFGPVKIEGYGLSASGSSLSVNRASGKAFSLGRNYLNNPESPNIVVDNAQTKCLFYRYYRSGSEFVTDNNAGAGYSVVDPGYYDDGTGTLAAVPGGQYTIQRIFYFPGQTNLLGIYYGRATYNSLLSAEDGISEEPFSEIENTRYQAILIGYLLVKAGTTNLSNTNDAKFVSAGLFRDSGTSGGGGGGGANSLDDLDDVTITSVASGDLLRYTGAVWENTKGLSGSYSVTGSLLINGTPITGSFSAGNGLTLSGTTFSLNTGSNHFILGTRKQISATDTTGASGINLDYNQSTGVISGSLLTSSIYIGAGNGLTGDGSVSLGSSASLAVGAGTGITVNSNDVQLKNAGSLTGNKVLKWDSGNTQLVNSTITDDGTNVSLTGDLTVGGILTAQEFYTEFVSSSIIYESGSTKFGDTSDDIHERTGSLNVSGSIDTTGNLYVGGNAVIDGVIEIDPSGSTGRLGVNTQVTSNDAISVVHQDSSGGIINARNDVDTYGTFINLLTDVYDGATNFDFISIGVNNSNRASDPKDGVFYMYHDNDWNIWANNTKVLKINSAGLSLLQGHITSSGNISSSAGIFAASIDVTGNADANTFSIDGSTVIDASENITGTSLDVTGEVEGNSVSIDGTTVIDSNTNFTGSNAIFSGNLDILGESISLSGSNTTIEHQAPAGSLRIQTIGGTNNKLILSSSGDIDIEQSMTMKNLNTSFQSSGSISGFTGQGFDINFSSQSSAEFDNLTIRGSMRVFELIINQIRATNGSLFVSSVGKVDSVVDLGTTDGQGRQEFALLFDTGSGDIGHGFIENDVIRAQRVNRNAIAQAGVTQSVDDNLIYRSDLTVTSVQDLKLVTASLSPGTTAPSSSFEFVRLGNTTNINRQGNVYLTSDDNYAPFIDVVDGITDHSDWNNSAVSGGVKVRVGKIDGINSPEFGDLTGYGMWASGSVYLEGSINATGGLVGGWAIEPGYLESNNIKIQSSGSVGGELISIGLTAGMSGNGIYLSGSGDFNLQADNQNYIKRIGSTLNILSENLIAKGNSVEISGSNFHLLNGNITASNVDLSGNITATTGNIGGFAITSDAITGSGFYLSGSATGNEFFISASNFNVKANGQLTASTAFIGGTSQIAGFTVSDTQINSGTNLVLKSNGQITGSNVLFTGGKISGSSLAIDVTNLTAKGNSVEISGSNFHLLNGNITASNVDLSGNITATTGNIGGFAITDSAITGSGFYLSGSATGNQFFISASNFNVKANGDLTASNANITGDIVANNITATTAGNIAGWTIGSNTLSSGDVYLSNDTNEKGLYISSSVNRLQVGEFNDYIPSPTTLSTGTRTETTSTDSKINGYISLDGFFLTNNTGSATDTASIFVPIIGTVNQNDTVIVTQPVEFIGYSDRANLGFTYDSFTDSVTVEIVSGSSNTVVASSEAFLRPTPSNPNLPGASKTLQVSFFYTGSQALASTGDLKAKITNIVDYNRTSTTGTLNRLVDINGLVVKKDTAVVNITNNQAFFYAGENRQFKWTPDELIFKGGELDITDLVVENVFVTSSNTNVIAVQAEDVNQDGLLWGIAANGDPYFAPISKSFYDFDSELRYDQSEERWQFDDELYVNGVLNGTTATFTGDLNAGDISGSTLESSGNTVVRGNLTVLGDTIISGSIDGHPVISPVASDSDSNTNGVVIQNLTVDAFGHLENIGTVDLDNRFVEKAGDTMSGNLILTDKLLSSQNNMDVDTGTEVVATVATSTYDAAFFDFVIKKTTNLRAGTVYAIHDGTNVEFTETSTQDLGDTSDVTLSVDIDSGNFRLLATAASDDWEIKALVRGL